MSVRPWLSALLTCTALVPATAAGEPLGPEEKAMVDRRLASPVPFSDRVKLAEGDTLFGEKSIELPAARVTKKADDLEGLVIGIVAPKGIIVHARVDELSIEPGTPKTKIVFRYAIHVEPGTRAGGKVRFTLSVVERTGLANTVASDPVSLTLDVVKSSPKPDDLVADFWGYRYYQGAANDRIKALEQRRVGGLSIKDGVRLPPLDKLGPRIAAQVFEFDRERRRIWVAHRHLVAASQHPDPKISGLAKKLVAQLDLPDDQLKDVPRLGGATVAKAEKNQPIETLQPTRVENINPSGGGGGGGGSLAPVGSYESGSEGDDPDVIPEAPRPSTEVLPPPGPPGTEGVAGAPKDGTVEGGLIAIDGDLFGARQRKLQTIPSYFRGLLLDDPNIAYGGGTRFVYARSDFKGNQALAAAIFYFAQASITRSLGLELTVPSQWVNLELDRTRNVYGLGNPLLAAKYRIYLPEVEGRQPALTFRARWSIPISAPHSIPPTTEFKAEDFSREVYFADGYAFNVNHTTLGLGFNLAYQYGMVLGQAQIYGDYYLPVIDGAGRFLSFQYVLSVGALPFEDLAGFFLEGRATTTLIGATRTELFAYLGARGRFGGLFEPSVWVGLPIGSVADISGVQLGVELRMSYDVLDVVGPTETRRESTILE